MTSHDTREQASDGVLFPYTDEGTRVQDDLFRHTNGQWLDTHEIPGDRGMDGAFYELRDRSEADVRAIIERAAEQGADAAGGASGNDGADAGAGGSGADAARAQRIGGLYAQFMDEDAIEARGVEPLKPLLARIDAAQTVEEFVAVASDLHAAGVGSLANLFVSIDPNNPQLNRVFAVQGGIFLPDEAYYREDEYAEIREKYLEHLRAFFELTGIEGDPADAMALETKIAAAHWDKVRTRDAVARNNPYTDREFAERWPLLHAWIERAVPEASRRETLNVWQPEALDGVSELLQNVPLDTWKLWLKNLAAHFAAPYLSKDVVRCNWEFVSKTLTGTTEQRERWKRGVAFVENAVGEDLGALFVAEHFPPEYKARMLELVDYLIRAYRESISEISWMSEETRKKALVKLEKFVTKIGYPEEWKDYSDVSVQEDLVATAMRANESETRRELEKLDRPVDGKEWLMTPQTVNAYYMPPANEIVFPAAILRPPFFDAEGDAGMNFAGIGAVIGHEIGHGFDDQGSRYDGDGRLENWWTEADREAFTERTARLVSQYDGLHPAAAPEASVNGELTLGENIGDLGGLGIGLKAYKLYLADHGLTLETAPVVNGLTAAQRFFLAWATIWKAKARKEAVELQVSSDPHSPAEFRANEPAKNLDAFHEAFGTKPGDGMYLEPEKRVTIW